MNRLSKLLKKLPKTSENIKNDSQCNIIYLNQSTIWEIEGVNTQIFEAYLQEFSKYKNKVFDSLEKVKEWLHESVKSKLTEKRIKSITYSDFYNTAFINHLNI